MSETEERLIIKSILVENFKSYAGVKEIGPFHPSFTSIVGPNGSGKSNVIDAMLFVFGYKARHMRQNVLKDLIHKSTKFPNLTKASVKVIFAKFIGEEEVPNSEFSIGRDVRTNAASNYYWNDRPSSYTEITTFLKNVGIDLDHNRFLILQGEVGSIAQMKPKATSASSVGLLDYIEDVIGTSEYVTPIQNKEKEIAQINITRDEAIGRMKHAKAERDALEDSKNEAEQYLDWQNTIKILHAAQINNKKGGLTMKITEDQKNVKEATEAHAKLLDSHKEERTKYETKSQEKSVLEKTLERQKAEANDASKKVREAKNANAELELSNKTLNNIKDQLEKERTKLTKDMTESTRTIESLSHSIETSEKDVKEKEVEYNKAKEEMEKMYQNTKDETSQLQIKLTMAQTELSDKNADETAISSKVASYQDEIKSIRHSVDEAIRVNEELQKDLEKAKNDLVDREREEKELSNRAEFEEKEIQRLTEILAEKRQVFDQKQAERRTVSMRHAELDGQRRQNQQKNRLVEGLEAFKRRENVQGYYGRLGSLATIDKKYDVAITYAAGSGLDFIVVDNDETGKLCLDELKAKNLGRTTFILLNKIRKVNNNFQAPPGSERLIDLCTVKDPSMKDDIMNALYHVLRDTLVTDTIERAKEIGYGQRQRVVTLSGDLIEPAGTMTGGGRSKPRSGGMDTFDEQEVQRLATQLSGLDNECSQLRREIDQIQAQLRTLNPEAARVAYEKAVMGLSSTKDAIQTIEERLRTAVRPEMSESDNNRIAELEENINQLLPQLADAKSAAIAAKKIVDELQSKIKDVGGIELKAQKVKVQSFRDSLSTLNKRIAEDKQKVSSLTRQNEKAEKRINDIKREQEENASKIAELAPKLAESERKFSEAQEKHNVLAKEASSTEDHLEVIKEELQKLKEELDEASSELEESEKVVKDAEAELEADQALLERLTKKLTEFNVPEESLREWEERDENEIEIEIAAYEDKVRNTNANISAIEEYKRKDEIYQGELDAFSRIDTQRSELQREYEDLRRERLTKFLDGFAKITKKLKEIYQMLTLGGDADLELVDTQDPFSEGITFSVRPPGKSWKHIANLSGGEKALSSLALVFSLHQFKPTPLYVMDEIDAAFDNNNVMIIANYLREKTTDAQFIVVSNRNHFFECADRLVGIFKKEDCASALTLEPSKFTPKPTEIEEDQNKSVEAE